jgi:hypothetical protein
MHARRYCARLLGRAWRDTLTYWRIVGLWVFLVGLGAVPFIFELVGERSPVNKLLDALKSGGIVTGIGIAGTFVLNLVKAPLSLHRDVETERDELQRKLEAFRREAEINISLMEGISIEHDSAIYVALLIRAVNRGIDVTVREWTSEIGSSEFVHWPISLPDDCQILVESLFSEQMRPKALGPSLAKLTSLAPLKRGVAVQGWLMFHMRGRITLEQIKSAGLVLKCHDDLGKLHTAETVAGGSGILAVSGAFIGPPPDSLD